MVTYETNISNYVTFSVLGEGYCGAAVVYLAKHNPSSTMVAIKKINMDRAKEEANLVQHEIILTKQLQHPNIIPYLTSFVSDLHVCIVSPLMAYGSCRDLLNLHFHEGLPESAIALLIRDVLDALDYIHRKGYIHRAIKASHVLISASGKAYLSGLKYACQIVEHGKWQRQIHSFPASTAKNLNWLSPEVLEQTLQGYNEKSDIYSVGMVICELANGAEPFAGVSTTLMLIEKVRGCSPQLLDCTTLSREHADIHGDNGLSDCYSNQINRRFSDALHNFTAICLQRDALCRPSAAQLLTHPFLKVNRRTLFLSELLKPAIPLSDRVVQNTDELADLEGSRLMSELDVNSYDWEF